MTKELQEHKMDRIYRLYVIWQASPPIERLKDEQDLQAFAKKYKVTEADLAQFENNPGYYEDLEREAQKWGRAKLPELLHLLYRQIKDKKRSSDIETFKKLITKDANAPTGNTINIFNLDDNQKRQIIEREARAAGLLTSGRKK
jgi:hypothetical protein